MHGIVYINKTKTVLEIWNRAQVDQKIYENKAITISLNRTKAQLI